MHKKKSIYISLIVLFTCFLAQGSVAQEVEITLESVQTSSTPIFVTGHEGDMTQIAGFQYEQNILINGVQIGTSSGTTTLIDPPMD